MESPLARGAGGSAPSRPAYDDDAGDIKAALVHEGFPTLAAAARTRAAAVYYGFATLSVGFLVVLAFALRESAKWRATLEGESGAWREFVKAEIHAMGLA